eukprot:TRINITY_DN21289_c0_g1_i1.p2 TRINITY_DN21289_c0_g1~~TRINITY_DN21289_c0_g1_i1.p2  ORF type:complete len:156 (+),score=58.88 TRINITY_DN21289_c0_g1_i1:268-735(+)
MTAMPARSEKRRSVVFDTKVNVSVYDSPQHVVVGVVPTPARVGSTSPPQVSQQQQQQPQPQPTPAPKRASRCQSQPMPTPCPADLPPAQMGASVEITQWRDALLLARKIVETTGNSHVCGGTYLDPLAAKEAAQRILDSIIPQHAISQCQMAAAC